MDWSDDRTQKQVKNCRVKGGYNSGMEMGADMEFGMTIEQVDDPIVQRPQILC